MSYNFDHDPCSDCNDVNAYIDPASKNILLQECHQSCAASGGSATPAFGFQGSGLPVNCREYQTRLQCWIRITWETFKCNCKPPCPKSLSRRGGGGGGGGGCC